MAKQRFRLQFKFWLDMNKADECLLAEQIEDLKRGGAFTKAVRDGIHLVVDLWHGNLDVLLTLFPWVEEAFYQRFTEQGAGPDSAIQAHLARLEQLLIEQGNKPVPTSSPKPFAPMVLVQEEGDLQLLKKAKSDGQSAQNFLNSAFNLVQ